MNKSVNKQTETVGFEVVALTTRKFTEWHNKKSLMQARLL